MTPEEISNETTTDEPAPPLVRKQRGDVVTYVEPSGFERVAIVTESFSATTVNLAVLGDATMDHDSARPPVVLVSSVVHASVQKEAPYWK